MQTNNDTVSVRSQGLSFAYPRLRGRRGSAEQTFDLALDDWVVERGEQIALHGPSGCGKTTLLNLIAGSLVPERGSLVVEGLDMATAKSAARRAHRIRRIGFVFQDSPLIESLEVLDNVLLPYRINPALHLNARVRERGRQLIESLGIGGREQHRPAELSIGERQRVAMARALVADPALLLADEPTAGLDPTNTAAVLDLVQGLVVQRGLTLILVTHDPAVLDRFERRLLVGRRATQGGNDTSKGMER